MAINHNILMLAAASMAILGSGAANALSIGLDSTPLTPGYDVMIADGDVGDVNGAPGAVTFVGPVSSWIVNVPTGVSMEYGSVDLNSINVSSPEGGSLLISLWESFADGPALESFLGGIGGMTTGSVQAEYYIDDVLVSSIGTFGAGAFAGRTPMFGSMAAGDSFELRIDVLINHDPGYIGSTSFNAAITATPSSPVPVPSAAVLLVPALLGMLGLGKRRLVKS